MHGGIWIRGRSLHGAPPWWVTHLRAAAVLRCWCRGESLVHPFDHMTHPSSFPQICAPCDSSCETCSGRGSHHCLSCSTPLLFHAHRHQCLACCPAHHEVTTYTECCICPQQGTGQSLISMLWWKRLITPESGFFLLQTGHAERSFNSSRPQAPPLTQAPPLHPCPPSVHPSPAHQPSRGPSPHGRTSLPSLSFCACSAQLCSVSCSVFCRHVRTSVCAGGTSTNLCPCTITMATAAKLLVLPHLPMMMKMMKMRCSAQRDRLSMLMSVVSYASSSDWILPFIQCVDNFRISLHLSFNLISISCCSHLSYHAYFSLVGSIFCNFSKTSFHDPSTLSLRKRNHADQLVKRIPLCLSVFSHLQPKIDVNKFVSPLTWLASAHSHLTLETFRVSQTVFLYSTWFSL